MILDCILAILVTLLTHFLSYRKNWGPVKASSFIAIFFGLSYQLFPQIIPDSTPFIAIGATFIGMVSVNKYYRFFNFIVAPLLFVILYYNLSPRFNGFGGALGTAACCSLLITIYLRYLKTTKRIIAPIRRLKLHTTRRIRKQKKDLH